MTVPVIWLTRRPGEIDSHGPWDTVILDDLFAGNLRRHQWTFEALDNIDHIPEGLVRAVVVLPARHHTSPSDVEWLNTELAKLKSCLLILAGDEEGIFPWRKVMHDHCRFWVQHPNPTMHGDMAWAFFYGCGDPHALEADEDPPPLPNKQLPWFFAGQVTHPRRRQAVNGLMKARSRTRGEIVQTQGFRQGLDPAMYLEKLRSTRVAPAPGGPFTPDTFRFYEALNAGCVPVVDARSPGQDPGYWRLVYGDKFPFPIAEDWEVVGGEIEALLKTWPTSGSMATAWWIDQQRRMVKRLHADLIDIGFDEPTKHWSDQITVVVTTSPVPGNPSTDMIDFTLDSIIDSMNWFRTPVVIACDGVRDEQSGMAADYGEYVRRLCWKALGSNLIQPVVASTHLHQARLTQLALQAVDTPLILFVEHDTPFNELKIDWATAVDAMMYGQLDVLRFHHESTIPAPHEHLMLDHRPRHTFGLPVMRTMQWSQRPHLASTDYYRRITDRVVAEPNNGFIEDTMHSIAGREPFANRIGIYAPEGSLCRTYHTDGRAGGPKFDDRLMW